MNCLKSIHNYLWNVPLISIIIIVGIILTIKLKGLQITKLKEALLLLFKKEEKDKNNISVFQAVCVSISATLGAGNIIGVAVAISLGGPGALIWLLLAILLGIPIKYCEIYLSIKYRIINNNEYLGGPHIYIEQALPNRFYILSKIYALLVLSAGILGIGTFIQSNGVTDAFKNIFNQDIYITNINNIQISVISLLIGLILAFISYITIIKGTKKIASVCEVLVPVVACIYLLICLIVIISNIKNLIPTFNIIIKSAFTKEALFSGLLANAIRVGVSKGVFAGEAGMGSSAIAISSTNKTNPKDLAKSAISSTILGTVFICFITGIVIILTESYLQNLNGINITHYAFTNNIIIPKLLSSILLFISIFVFAFTTIIGWNIYCIKCLTYLTNKKIVFNIYQYMYIMMIFIGAFLSIDIIWLLTEILVALIIIVNLIPVCMLCKEVKI